MPDLAQKLRTACLMYERGESTPIRLIDRVRTIADEVQRLESREQARMSASLADSCYARPRVLGPEAERFGENDLD